MAKGDIHSLKVPYFMTLRNKRHSLNLNQYRNAHYQLTNKLKREFKDIITDDVLDLPVMSKVKIHYKIFYENKRLFDLDNIASVVSKFTQDALVELGRLPDDNYQHIQQITATFGGVSKNDAYVEVRIKEI